jgi:hypothetical protein
MRVTAGDRTVFSQPELSVARAEAVAASSAMKVSPHQFQRSQNARKCLLAPPHIACGLSAWAQHGRRVRIGVVCVEALFDRAPGQLQGLPTHGRLQCFQIEFGKTLPPEEGFDIPHNLSGEKAAERSLF